MRKHKWSSRQIKTRRYATRWMEHSVLRTRAFTTLAAAMRTLREVQSGFDLEYAYVEDLKTGEKHYR